MPVRQTLKSLFNIHNETGNVWTHLLGFLLFAGLTFYVIAQPPMPLALGKRQIDHLWLSVRDRVHGLADGLHHLHDRLPHLPDLSANLHQLQESLDSLVHEVQEEVHHAAQALHHRVHSLHDNLQHATERLNTRLNSLLEEALTDVLLWPVPRWPVYVFMAGAMTCLLTSAVCHLFGCCSKHVAQMIWRFDYAGIAILIVASFYPPVYYSFLCQPYWRLFYLLTTTLMGVGAVSVALLDVFQRSEWRPFRAAMFAALGCWGVVPLIHACWVQAGVEAVRQATGLDALMGALYLIGALIYATRVPERWLPGRFDVWFHGHQIFHVLIVVAALIHYRAVMILLHWRDASGGCAAPAEAVAAGSPAGGGPAAAAARGLLGESALAAALEAGGGTGHELHAIEQASGSVAARVWEHLREYAVEYLRVLMSKTAAAGSGPGHQEPMSPDSHTAL
ncbi:hypothetical protein GPECTOR_39g436 [Gonium pectorale]|uniref:Uncharacterized protein n=1 Tax=Gonium pectorale TaxID=33097 RepID=A0A150GAS1_GONPE|nr:hypothetical protein GPECTOR_39g436 [Gonium pectorale]|eukprot:KXZ46942.1 hypothetical protein GPECTOR_39g436 [Gonium pectorale]